MSTFAFGMLLVAGGLAVAIADLTSLDFDETASVAALAGGAVVLIAATMAPRTTAARDNGTTTTTINDAINDADDGSDDEVSPDRKDRPDTDADDPALDLDDGSSSPI